MSERGEGFNFNENLSKSFKLADSFRKGGVFGEKSGEEAIKANQKVTEILSSSYQVGFESEGQYNNISQYESVVKMIGISKPEGGRTPRSQENAKNALFEVGLALSQNKEVLKAATEGADELNKILPSNLHEIQPYILSVILTNGKGDVQGQELVSELVDLFKLKNRSDKNSSVYKDDYSEAYKKLTVKLDDIYDDLDSKSKIDGTEGRIETMRGYVFDINEENKNNNSTKVVTNESESVVDIVKEIDNAMVDDEIEQIDLAALRESTHSPDGGKESYRSSIEIDPVSFVDAIFNQENPYLRFTPPTEWWKKLSPEGRYLIKIEQKLAVGAEVKGKIKDMSFEDARKNAVYAFPSTELKMILEMPGVTEAMQFFVRENFEIYNEDGRKLLRLKQCKIEDYNNFPLKNNEQRSDFGRDNQGYVRNIKDGSYVIDPKVARNLGDIGSGFGFEEYKEEMYRKMALKKIYPNRVNEIDNDCKGFYNNLLQTYIDNRRRSDPKIKNKTNPELETEWIKINALEEKRAVATAWNFLFVGNIVESADVYRQLKPTQINSDKLRTAMMPLEKFLQKMKVKKTRLDGSEEFFGGSIALWAGDMLSGENPESSSAFRKKLLYAANNDRRGLTFDEAKWRLFPKRTMCSFVDSYKVNVNGRNMSMSQALIEGGDINIKGDDADVFVDLRDTWDAIIDLNPSFIGKSREFDARDLTKWVSPTLKGLGVIKGIDRIPLDDGTFGYMDFVDRPETYAWTIANCYKLEGDLDVPILNRKALGANKENYDFKVKEVLRDLKVSAEITVGVQEILNAKGWNGSKQILKDAQWRAAGQESKRLKEEKEERKRIEKERKRRNSN